MLLGFYVPCLRGTLRMDCPVYRRGRLTSIKIYLDFNAMLSSPRKRIARTGKDLGCESAMLPFGIRVLSLGNNNDTNSMHRPGMSGFRLQEIHPDTIRACNEYLVHIYG